MAEKNKNSQLNIHYSRTMTTDNLSKAANYVGGYVLRGLGALGKIMTAPLTGGPLGPATVVLPKTKKLLDAERKLRETQEELIGKAMTWVSPLNYGTALWNGHGLDARKGEEEVASWAPAWQAVGRLGELYVGPKAVKGVKSAPRAVVNTAAKAGVKPAKTSLKFFERKPSKNNIVGASYDYRMEDPKGSMDFLKQFFALLKINGKEYTLEGLRDAANVQQGLPKHIQSYLNLNTVERAVRAMRKNGYSEREIQLYIDKVNEEMNKVKVGMYSDLEYNAAGAQDFGGFYNKDLNFISVNRDAYLKDPKFTPDYVMKHEGRHLIDYRTGMVDELNKILEEAYDKDFLDIPNHEDAGSLKGYEHMNRERVTTNRDARDVLLSSKGKNLLNEHEFMLYASKNGLSNNMVDFLNKIIKYAQPEDIVNAVENSNGYGKRYINYLKKNNKLTPAKIEQLRLAMIHVPSYLLPIAGGYTLYNLFNQPLQQLQYLKQGGKMIRKGQNGFKYLEKQTDWFPKYKYTASTFSNMKNNLGIYFLNKHPNYPISKYKPTKGNPNNTYYSIPNLKYDVARNLSRAYLTNKPLKSFDEVYNDNKSGTSRETGAVNLGKYHVSTGQDEKGRYISYYDKYDWNLLEQMGLEGNSFEIYDRIYEDEWPEIYLKIFLNKQGGKMNILEFLKQGGQIRKMLTAAGGPIELYDTLWVDNWKNRLTSPTIVAKQLTELTSKIPIKYLGGSKDNVRKEFWKQEPVFQHAVDSIANQYGISPESLKYRLDKEGFTDRLIQRRNNRIKIGALRFEPRGYELLNNPNYGLDGTQIGLDDAKTYIDSGKVKLINENWDERGPFKNEKGRMTYPVNPVTLNDGMGIVAAHLKYFRDEASLDFPNGSEYDLDRYANAYYNRGTYGGKKWVLAGAKGYSYRKKGGMLEFLKNGSGIHIKKKNRGKFTSYCGGKVTDECIRKAKASGNPTLVKRATFALNARHFKHRLGGSIVEAFKLRRLILNSLNNMIND